jgi:hypothetical protein
MDAISFLARSEFTLMAATLVGLALTAVAIARDIGRSRISARTSQ